MPSFFKRSLLPKLRAFPLSTEAIEVLSGAAAFRRCLLEKISQATQRIYINPAIKYTKSCCVGDTWMPEIRTDSLRA
ncbi:hypothetical protein BZ164_08685 [Pseudomonas veronii]|nr:hypothetical protein BZ164_08685 [Pseudomonas veronii]